MSHSSEKRWGETSAIVTGHAGNVLSALENGEQAYQDLLEVYQYAGGTADELARLLFKDDMANNVPPLIDPSADMVERATDAIAAMTSVHQLWQAMNNVAIIQSDRTAALRRMT